MLTLRRTAARLAVLSVVSTAGLGALAPSAEASERWRKPALYGHSTVVKTVASVPVTTVTAPVTSTTRTTTTSTTTTTTTSTATVDPVLAYETEVLRLTNVERAKAGLAALRRSTCAEGFARTWSQTMARTGTFAHQSLSPIMSRCAARGAGENIAYGNVTPAQMVTMWMNSSGHRANILRASFTHLGVGAAKTSSGRWYATQDFLTV